MSIVTLILGFVLGKTADLTHRHAKLSENEFLVTIKRLAGPKLEKLYFLSSVLSLWLVSISFCLTGCDSLYSGIQLVFESVNFPSENTVDFSRFSYQYIGLIFVVIEFILIFPKDITKLFLITSNAAFIAFFGILFVLIVGTYDLIYHTPTFFTQFGPSGINSISLFGEFKFSDFLYSVGVFELSFQIHNEVINLLRVGKEQQKNSRNLSIAYRCVQTIYIVTGFFGAVIMSARYTPGNEINTLLSLFSHNDSKFIFILAIINQFLVGLQMLALAALMLFITRSQVFTLIYGEENSPPEWIYYLFNVGILTTLYLAEIFNFSPSTAMCIAGSLFGLVIMYTVPIYIHLKCMNLKAKYDSTKPYLLDKDMQISISSVIPEKQTKTSRVTQNVLYSILIIQGFVTLIGVIIYLAQQTSSS